MDQIIDELEQVQVADNILSSKNSERDNSNFGNATQHKRQESVAFTGRFHTTNNREQKKIDSTPKPLPKAGCSFEQATQICREIVGQY